MCQRLLRMVDLVSFWEDVCYFCLFSTVLDARIAVQLNHGYTPTRIVQVKDKCPVSHEVLAVLG